MLAILRKWNPPRLGCHQLVLSAFAAALFLLALPILIVSHPPLIDLPNHIARHYIAASQLVGHDVTHPANLYYDFEWHPVAYLAGDLLYALAAGILNVYSTTRVVLCVVVFLWLLAPMVLYRCMWDEYSIWPLFSSLGVYNLCFAWGFENYVISAPIIVLAFAFWIALARAGRPLAMGLFTVIATIVYFLHLIAFLLLGLLVCTYEAITLLQANTNVRGMLLRILRVGFPFLPGILFLFLLKTLSTPPIAGRTIFGEMPDRLQTVVSPFIDLSGYYVQIFAALGLALTASIYFLGWRRKWIKFFPGMLPTLLVLSAISLAVPTTLMGTYLSQIRLPILIFPLLIASTRWEGAPRRSQQLLGGLCATLLVFSSVARAADWVKYDREEEEFIAGIDRIQCGARLLVGSFADYVYPFHSHSASYAVIERHAFVPGLTAPSTLNVTPDLRRIDAPQTVPIPWSLLMVALRDAEGGRIETSQAIGTETYFHRWPQDYSDVLVLGAPSSGTQIPDLLVPVYHGSFFTLYHNRSFHHINIGKCYG